MKVDFNNLRAQAAYALDNLTKELNAGILKHNEVVFEEDKNGKEVTKRGNVLVDSDDIQKHMEELRSLVMGIASVYEPDDDEFKDMSNHIKKNGGVAHFNEDLG